MTMDRYLISKLDQKNVIQNYTKILHLVNLTAFENLINIFSKNIISLKLNDSDNSYKFLTHEINNLKKHLTRLIPKTTSPNTLG